MMKDISQTLAEAGISVKHLGDGNQKVKCPKCQPPHNPRDNPLSVTIQGGSVVWKCHHCEFTGGSGTDRYFRSPTVYAAPKVPENRTKGDFVVDYFLKRGISEETVEKFGIYSQREWICTPYIDKGGEIVNVKYRTVDKQFRQSKDAKKILFNYNRVHNQSEVIFCEGEIDVMSLAEAGFDNATTLSDGAASTVSKDPKDTRFLGMQNSPLQATKYILFCDNDKAGNALRDSILYRVGKDKCWYVNLSQYEDCKDANDVLVKHGKAKLKELVDNAIPYPVQGLYRANDYQTEIMDMYEGRYVKPIEIGLSPDLDELYKIQKGTFHCITGIPNHGKSLMLSSILLKLAENHGWKFAIFSPEHSTAMHIRRMLQIYLKKSFDDSMYGRMSEADVARGLDFINEHFFFIETRDAIPSLDLILQISKSFAYKYGAAAQGIGVVVDPYNEVDPTRSQGKREDEHIRDFISHAKKFCRMHNAVFWCVAHPTKMPRETNGTYAAPDSYSISGSSHWSNMADCILTVHRDFETKLTSVLTRKIREQDLYGAIGECFFKYNVKKFSFEQHVEDHSSMGQYWDKWQDD